MSVATHLEGTASTLIPSTSEKASIATSIGTLRSRLSTHFGSELNEQVQFGSSTRGTMLPRKADEHSDVDYMIVFDNTNDYKPSTFIERLRKFAAKAYATSDIYQSHPTVVLSLNHIKFELVPAYRSWWSGLNIPAPASSFTAWISTDPNAFNSELEAKNGGNDYQIKPLIRLLKYWNAVSGYVFDSYGLEKWVVGNYFVSAKYLRPYFYEAIQDISVSWDAAQWRKDRVSRAKEIVARVKDLEAQDQPSAAEKEIKKIIPEL